MIYRGAFENTQVVNPASDNTPDGQIIIISIYDTEAGSGDDQVTELELAATPMVTSVIDNDEDKFTPIRAKQCVIQCFTRNGLNITNFATGGDNRWRVEVDINELGRTVFIGFLSISDLRQSFQPDPNLLTLTAYDGLGALKDIPLVNFSDETPQNESRLADFITWALAKTGLSLPLYVINNIRHGGGKREYTQRIVFNLTANTINIFSPTSDQFYVGQEITITGTASNNITTRVTEVAVGAGVGLTVADAVVTEDITGNVFIQDTQSLLHLYDSQFIDAKTFEDEIGTCEDCYTGLEKILGESCFLTQYKGRWYIINPDEFDDNLIYQGVFNTDGTFDQFLTATTLNKSIGVTETLSWMDGDGTEISLERPLKYVQHEYKYEKAKELVCNIDFSRGSSDTTINFSSAEQTIDYTPECWTHFKTDNIATGPADDQPGTGTYGYIRKFYQYGYEKEKYVVIKNDNVSVAHYLKSERLYVTEGDKIEISISFRTETNLASNTIQPMQVRLVAEDGTYYALRVTENGAGPSNFIDWPTLTDADDLGGPWSYRNQLLDTTEWKSMSYESQPCPKTGYLEIRLMNRLYLDEGAVEEMYFDGLSVSLNEKINGAYQLFNGEIFKVSQTTNTVASRTKDVYIGTALRRTFKGALMFISRYDEIITTTITFSGFFSFNIPGYHVGKFRVGQIIKITGTGSNNITTKILAVNYSTIFNATGFSTEQPVTAETSTGTLSEPFFVLSKIFYAGNVFPDTITANDIVHPYGYIRLFSVWNQYNRIMTKAEGNIDGMETGDLDSDDLPDLPDVVHKYRLTDSSTVTNSKFFMMLHHETDLNLCQSNVYLHEVYDQNLGKVYDDVFEFKYMTQNE